MQSDVMEKHKSRLMNKNNNTFPIKTVRFPSKEASKFPNKKIKIGGENNKIRIERVVDFAQRNTITDGHLHRI